MSTFLHWHLGLGDALLCNGLVRELVKRGHQLVLPCWEHNLKSLEVMFSDLKDSVQMRVFSNGAYLVPHIPVEIGLGYYGKDFDSNRWDESFYRQAGVPFLCKWTSFRIGSDVDAHEKHAPYWFIHDDEKRGFRIPMEGHRPEQTESIFDHYTDLIDAREIHCINSSFAILADLIDAPGRKVLHRYARPDGGVLPVLGRKWEILDARPD